MQLALSGMAVSVYILPLCSPALADTFGSGTNTFTIDFADIGYAGNAGDTRTNTGSLGRGAVPYEYRMGTYEITQDAIAKATTSGMLNVTAGTNYLGNRPATSMSWYEAAAFVNWLNTSSGKQAAYDLTFTTNWSMNLWSTDNAWTAGGTNLYRHKDAFYFLPSDNEWYKAAFYNPGGSNYFLYATGSDTAPTKVASGTNAGTAVYTQPFAQGPAEVTLSGGLSPLGTMGQSGNAWEFLETAFSGINNSPTNTRVFRGGTWYSATETNLQSVSRFSWGVTNEAFDVGFRVASLTNAPSGNFWAPGAGGGGSGTWGAGSDVWATAAGSQGTNPQAATGQLGFGNTAGTVTVSGTVSAAFGMRFATHGYTITDGTSITLAGTNAAQNTIATDAGVGATINSVLAGSAGMTKAGTGTLTLGGANTYTGTTTVAAGTLAITNGGALSDNSAVVLSNTAGATLQVNSSEAIGSLQGGGATGGNVSIAGGQTLTVNETGQQTFAGAITNAGALVKAGNGTLTLSGANIYAGATTVAGGTLRIDGNARLGNTTNTLTISNAGVLDVTAAGTLTNAITIGAGHGVLSNSSAGSLVIAGNVVKDGTVFTSRSGSGTNIFAGVISGASANSDFVVDGGTTVFSNVMTYNGPTIITNGGTLVLGVDDAMPSGSDLILGGGTFLVDVLDYNADSSSSMGTLTLTADSAIDLGGFGTSGDRNLVFADSSGVAINWNTNAVLTITNWQGVANQTSTVTKLLFGTGGLTTEQLAQIRFADQDIDGGQLLGAQGELAPIPEAPVVWGAAALAACIVWRERRRLRKATFAFLPPTVRRGYRVNFVAGDKRRVRASTGSISTKRINTKSVWDRILVCPQTDHGDVAGRGGAFGPRDTNTL